MWPKVENGLPMKIRSVLLIGHGSRVAETNQEFLGFVERVRTKIQGFHFQPVFLELARPTIQEGIDGCVEAGSLEVIVIPVMMSSAGHVKRDIPAELEKARYRYPQIHFFYGRPFGLDPRMLAVVEERIHACGGARGESEREETAVLLASRGSSDPEVNGDFCKLARIFWEAQEFRWVEVCFLGATPPDLREGLKRCLSLGAKRVIVVPYLLFKGFLLGQMRQEIRKFQEEYPEREFLLTDPLGFHPSLVAMLAEQISRAPVEWKGKKAEWQSLLKV
jgi:sirohydrochlorin cobaltochelatase